MSEFIGIELTWKHPSKLNVVGDDEVSRGLPSRRDQPKFTC